jgi:hypothetical protein
MRQGRKLCLPDRLFPSLPGITAASASKENEVSQNVRMILFVLIGLLLLFAIWVFLSLPTQT